MTVRGSVGWTSEGITEILSREKTDNVEHISISPHTQLINSSRGLSFNLKYTEIYH